MESSRLPRSFRSFKYLSLEQLQENLKKLQNDFLQPTKNSKDELVKKYGDFFALSAEEQKYLTMVEAIFDLVLGLDKTNHEKAVIITGAMLVIQEQTYEKKHKNWRDTPAKDALYPRIPQFIGDTLDNKLDGYEKMQAILAYDTNRVHSKELFRKGIAQKTIRPDQEKLNLQIRSSHQLKASKPIAECGYIMMTTSPLGKNITEITNRYRSAYVFSGEGLYFVRHENRPIAKSDYIASASTSQQILVSLGYTLSSPNYVHLLNAEQQKVITAHTEHSPDSSVQKLHAYSAINIVAKQAAEKAKIEQLNNLQEKERSRQFKKLQEYYSRNNHLAFFKEHLGPDIEECRQAFDERMGDSEQEDVENNNHHRMI